MRTFAGGSLTIIILSYKRPQTHRSRLVKTTG